MTSPRQKYREICSNPALSQYVEALFQPTLYDPQPGNAVPGGVRAVRPQKLHILECTMLILS